MAPAKLLKIHHLNMYTMYNINVCVATADDSDYYKDVAINRFPIILIDTQGQPITELLRQDNLRQWIKTNIRQKTIYDSSKFYIRHIESSKAIDEIIPVKDIFPDLFQ